MAFMSFYAQEITNTIDFMMDGYDKPVFQTSEKERGKVVFQLVTLFLSFFSLDLSSYQTFSIL